jgi:alanine dehydrogenase
VRIGIPSEVKTREYRVAVTPAGVHALIRQGNTVVVQQGAGVSAGLADDEYLAAGAKVVPDAPSVWGESELVVKVKEPIPSEYSYFRPDLSLFTFLHLAADRPLTEALLASGMTAIAYETVRVNGALPLLTPMSEIAGRLAVAVGSNLLMRSHGGPGILLGGIAGAAPARVVILGGGVAGEHAATVAVGMGASVTVVDISLPRLRELDRSFGGRVRTVASTPWDIEAALDDADLVVGSVLLPGAAAPKLVSKDMIARMRSGSVLMDIAIDQGGCFEGSRPTTHDYPTFQVHDATLYCVANMPGSVPVTATRALTNATLPFVLELAGRGVDRALSEVTGLGEGLNIRDGEIANRGVEASYSASVSLG